MYNLTCGDRGSASDPRGLSSAQLPRATAWLFGFIGAGLATAGILLETHGSGWLAMIAVGLILAGVGYWSQQIVTRSPWSLRRCRTWARTVADSLAIHDSKRGGLLLLAGALWFVLMLVTALSAILWGHTAGLFAVCIGGTAALAIEILAARRLGA